MSSDIAINQGEARRITEHICILLDTVSGQMDRLAQTVQAAYSKRVDQVLGYKSWADYSAKELRPHTENLTAPIRRELVSKLTNIGLSTRAQAPVLGVSHVAIIKAQKQVVTGVTTSIPEESSSDDFELAAPDYEEPTKSDPIMTVEHRDLTESVDETTGEILDVPAPKTVTGLDGKHYTVPERKPSKPRRTPITEQFTSQTVKLNGLVDSFTRLIGDDRFDTNKQNIADANASDIKRAIDALSKVLDALNNK